MINLISDRLISAEPNHSYGTRHYWQLALLFLLGLVIRMWGLGDVGLHGDEEIMGLAVRGILETGLPYHPSGMLYPRALSQLYLMSTSVLFFGETEWALRLPSAIVGACCTLAAFYLGKRFLEPGLNFIFVAVVTFLPVMIEISQTARMYVFLVFGVMIFGILVFRWERTGRFIDFVAALAAWLIVMEIHRLAVFAVPLFFFPGLSRASIRYLAFGSAAALISYGAFRFWTDWIGSQYPRNLRPEPTAVVEKQTPLDSLLSFQMPMTILFIILGFVIIVGAWAFMRKRKIHNMPALSLLFAGFFSCALLHYHVGLVLILFGTIEWCRNDEGGRRLLTFFLASIAVMLFFQLSFLSSTGDYPGRKLIGAIVGAPSIWPAIKLAIYSPIAFLIYCLAFACAAVRIARRERVPDHFLFFCLAVWGPVVGIGLFMWYVPSRYTLVLLPFLLLCCVAGMQFLYQSAVLPYRPGIPGSRAIGLGALITILSINPISLSGAVKPGYDSYPDHKGAADFIKSLELPENDIVIAEDALQQTYYLGIVDYRLLNIDVARDFAYVESGQVKYQYTGTPIIGTGDEFEDILDSESGGDIYIVGSGENFEDGRLLMRGNGIAEVLESDKLETIYVGRDGKTKIWKRKKPGP